MADDDILSHDRIQAETAKLIAESANLNAETARLNRELPKVDMEVKRIEQLIRFEPYKTFLYAAGIFISGILIGARFFL